MVSLLIHRLHQFRTVKIWVFLVVFLLDKFVHESTNGDLFASVGFLCVLVVGEYKGNRKRVEKVWTLDQSNLSVLPQLLLVQQLACLIMHSFFAPSKSVACLEYYQRLLPFSLHFFSSD